MKLFVLSFGILAATVTLSADNWPQWRGPLATGAAVNGSLMTGAGSSNTLINSEIAGAAAGPIFPSACAAASRIVGSVSLSAWVSSLTAGAASGPIFPSARAA